MPNTDRNNGLHIFYNPYNYTVSNMNIFPSQHHRVT